MFDPPWVTRDGRILKIGEMEDEHIQNCIYMITERKNWRRGYLARLRLELFMRELGIRSHVSRRTING